jgi:hypothetical protein
MWRVPHEIDVVIVSAAFRIDGLSAPEEGMPAPMCAGYVHKCGLHFSVLSLTRC